MRRCNSVCVVTDAETLYECRPRLSGQKFRIECPPDDVIKIHSAEVGFLPDSQHETDPQQCEVIERKCTLSIEVLHDIITKCSERRRCQFNQQDFREVSLQCPSPNGNSKRINRVTYSCIKGKLEC